MKGETMIDEQQWLWVNEVEEYGWQRIKNKQTNTYLTSELQDGNTKLTVRGRVEKTGKSIAIEDVVLHKDYDATERKAYNDIAVVTLVPNTAQLWSFDKTHQKLTNKKYGTTKNNWTIPEEGSDGFIEYIGRNTRLVRLKQKEDCSLSSDLELKTNGKEKGRKGCDFQRDSQIWTRIKNENPTFFTLRHKATGKLFSQVQEDTKGPKFSNKFKIKEDGLFFNKKVQPLCIATKTNNDPQKWQNKTIEVLGFATKDDSGTVGVSLKSASMTVFTQKTCEKKLQN